MSLRQPPGTVVGGDLQHAYSQGSRTLRRSWLLNVSVGEALGFCIPAAVGVLVLQRAPAVVLAALVAAGALEGLVLGVAQSRVLHREFFGFARRDWAVLTSAAAAFAWLVGMLPSTFYSTWSTWPLVATIPVATLSGILVLGSIGGAQWFVLRRHVARAWIWVPANAAAWCAGLLVFAGITSPLWREGQSPWLIAGIGALGGAAMAVTMAGVTGFFLARLRLPSETTAPAGVPEDEWVGLGGPTDRYAVFDPSLADGLPDPVQRWLLHSITPGTPLLVAAEVEAEGTIRLGRAWHRFRSRQRTSLPHGFIWAARTRLAGLPVHGFDRFTRLSGEMRWRLLGRLRLMSASDERITRSAAGRHAIEVLATLPAAALDPAVRWEPVDHDHARALLRVGGETQQVTITVGEEGRLQQAEMRRWGTPPDGSFGLHRFGATCQVEGRFDGYRVPTSLTVGWHLGSDRWDEGRSIHVDVTRCSFY